MWLLQSKATNEFNTGLEYWKWSHRAGKKTQMETYAAVCSQILQDRKKRLNLSKKIINNKLFTLCSLKLCLLRLISKEICQQLNPSEHPSHAHNMFAWTHHHTLLAFWARKETYIYFYRLCIQVWFFSKFSFKVLKVCDFRVY